jgi:glyoxylate/hydroxypyruvate reductase A
MSIAFFSKSDSDLLALLQQKLPNHTLHQWPDCPDPAAVRYAIAWGAPDDFFAGMDNLQAILSLGAGVDHLLKNPGLPAGVPIIRLTDAGMADKIAEYVLYGTLRAQRGFYRYEQLQRDQVWQPLADIHAHEFSVGIMGLGVIGNRCAEVLSQTGFKVTGWRRSRSGDNCVPCYFGAEQLNEFLGELNVLVCLLPLTDATTGIIDRQVLQQMPAGGHLINAARGGHVVDDDLIQALDSGHLQSALLDVCVPEPPPADHPFWRHPGISLTPHVAGPTQQRESIEQIVASIKVLDSNGTPPGLVDATAGY